MTVAYRSRPESVVQKPGKAEKDGEATCRSVRSFLPAVWFRISRSEMVPRIDPCCFADLVCLLLHSGKLPGKVLTNSPTEWGGGACRDFRVCSRSSPLDRLSIVLLPV